MKIVFMGTPEFAVPSLQMLYKEGHQISLVVTQPDRPKGRKKIITPPPVKIEAEKLNLLVYQPEKIKHAESIAYIQSQHPDIIVTAAYGQILPKAILDIPRLGCINIHASLLPKFRGGAPIHHAVMQGEKMTGVTIMFMEEGLDTGAILSQLEVQIEENDTTGTMFEKLSQEGSRLLHDTLPLLIQGKIQAIPQNHALATYAPNLKREDEYIHWNKTSYELFCQVRGLNPYPGAYTIWQGDTLKIWSCTVVPKAESRVIETSRDSTLQSIQPGTILAISSAGIDVSTSQGILRLHEIQLAGKKAMHAEQWARGYQIRIGDRFDT